MKKVLFIFALTVIITMGFTSCRKCEVCNKESEPEVRLCENDYGSKAEYGLTVDTYEAAGFTCR